MEKRTMMLFALAGLVFLSLTPLTTAFPNPSAEKVIGASQEITDGRERWWNANWHKRFYLALSSVEGYRAGEYVEYPLPVINNLDYNSLRAVVNGEFIPTEYDHAGRNLRFVTPFDIVAGIEYPMTIYYDVLSNGIKQIDYAAAEWIEEIIDTGGVDDTTEGTHNHILFENGLYYYEGHEIYRVGYSWYYTENDTLLTNSVVLEYNDQYYYRGQEIYQETSGRWYYMNGTEAFPTIIFDYDGNQYLWESPDGNTYQVYQDVGGSWNWYYMNGTEIVGTIIVNGDGIHDDHFFFKDMEVYYDEVTDTWYFSDGGIVTHELYYLGQSVVDDYFYGGENLANIVYGNDPQVDSYHAGSVRAVGMGSDSYQNSQSVWVRESLTSTVYRGHPNLYFQARSNVATQENAWASSLLNLDGGFIYNDVWVNRHNFDQFLIDEFPEATIDPEIAADNKLHVLTEAGVIDPEALDFDVDGHVMASDAVHLYDPSGIYNVGDELRVIPFIIDTDYIALYDEYLNTAFAVTFKQDTAFGHLVLEAWRKEIGGQFTYFVNVSLNHNYWWYEPEAGQELHLDQSGDFDFMLSYLYNCDTVTDLLDELGKRTNGWKGLRNPILKTIKKWENSLPLRILIHSPLQNAVFRGTPVKIKFDVECQGETLYKLYLKYKGNKIEFSGTSALWINYDDMPNVYHYATEGMLYAGTAEDVNFQIPDLGGAAEFEIQAQDTNGTIISASLTVSIDSGEFAILMGVVAFGFAGVILIAYWGFKSRGGRVIGRVFRSTSPKKPGMAVFRVK